MDLEQLKFPVGKLQFPNEYNDSDFAAWIKIIEHFPSELKSEVERIAPEQLDWKYRPDGWNIRQVVHHCADSHMNAFIRFKLTLTEDSPEVKPYHENLFARLSDTLDAPIHWSLDILTGLHRRWTILLRNLSESDLLRTYVHAEYKKTFELRQVMALYSWHCQHHLAHIKQAKEHCGAFN